MADEMNKQKQDADKDRAPEQVKTGNFTAEELAEQASYDGSQEMAQRISSGEEATGNQSDRNVAGQSKSS